ncbi:SRPBCC family protein [Streptomyces sp. NPDC003480]
MAEGTLSTVREQVKKNPVADRLKHELEDYLQARLETMAEDLGERLGEGARRLSETHLGPGMLSGLVLKGGKKLLGGGLLGGGEEGGGGGGGGILSKAKDTLLGKAQEAAGGRREKRSSGVAKGLMIIEDLNVGVPVREAYNQWTQFTEFDRFTKGVENVEQDDEISSRWQFRIAKVRRRYRGIVTEEVPDQRIAWNSEGAKGTTKGVVTFHPLGDHLTKVLLCMQYFPKGPFERVGSLWRAQGRRARLDLKLYRAFIMERQEATGAWRGEIREGEVVRSPEEVEEEEQQEPEEEREERGRDEDEDEERYPEDEEEEEEEGEEPEEGYEDEEEGDEDDYASEESDEGDREEDEDEDRYDETEEEGPQGRRRRG